MPFGSNGFGSGGYVVNLPTPSSSKKKRKDYILSQKDVAESKGLHLSSLKDVGKVAKGTLNAVLDIAHLPQAALVAATDNDPNTKLGETFKPKNIFGEYNEKIKPSDNWHIGNTGFEKFLANAALDPAWALGIGEVGAVVKAGEAGAKIAKGVKVAEEAQNVAKVAKGAKEGRAALEIKPDLPVPQVKVKGLNKVTKAKNDKYLANAPERQLTEEQLAYKAGKDDAIKRSLDYAESKAAREKKIGLKIGVGKAKAQVPLFKFGEGSKLAKGAAFAGNKIPAAGALAKALHETFSTNAGVHAATNEARKAAEAGADVFAHRVVRDMEKLHRKVKKTDQEKLKQLFVHGRALNVHPEYVDAALTGGREFSEEELAALNKMKENWNNLSKEGKDFHEAYRNELDRMFNEEDAVGLYKPHPETGEVVKPENYVPFIRARQGMRTRTGAFNAKADPAFTKQWSGRIPQDLKDYNYMESFQVRARAGEHAKAAKVWADQVGHKFGDNFATETRQMLDKGMPAQQVSQHIDELAAERGMRRVESKKGDELLQGKYLPNEVADTFEKFHEKFNSPKSWEELGNVFQSMTRVFKMAAYTINPGHLVTDFVGNTVNLWLRNSTAMAKAASNPAIAHHAAQLMRYTANPTKFKNADEKLVSLAGGKIKLSYRELDNIMAHNRVSDAGFAGVDLAGKHRRAIDKAQRIGNSNDNLTRIYGYLAMLNHEGRNLGKAATKEQIDHVAMKAAEDVRIATFDYSDLTETEKRVFRTIAPFYTWMRKNTPYQWRTLAEHPAKAMAFFKAQDQFQHDKNHGDIPDYLLPQWAQNDYIRLPWGNVKKDKDGNYSGSARLLNLKLPMGDLNKNQGSGFGIPSFSDVANSMNPYFKIPLELAQGTKFGDMHMPVEENKALYGLRALGGPIGSALAGQLEGKKSKFNNISSWAAPFTGVRPYELDAEQAQKNAEYILNGPDGLMRKEIIKYRNKKQLPTADELKKLNHQNALKRKYARQLASANKIKSNGSAFGGGGF